MPEQEKAVFSDVNYSLGHCQKFVHVEYPSEAAQSFSLIGPAIKPDAIFLEVNGREYRQEIHKLDLSNLYTINRYIMAGSCPHVFFKDSVDGTYKYFKELFSKTPGKIIKEEIEIPRGVRLLIIAELENEHTYLRSIHIDGVRTIKNKDLYENEFIAIPVEPGMRVKLTGYYIPTFRVHYNRHDPIHHNELISKFLLELNLGCRFSTSCSG